MNISMCCRGVGLGDGREVEELLSLFAKGFNILFTTKTPKIKAVKDDPEDDKFIECAVALKAEVDYHRG